MAAVKEAMKFKGTPYVWGGSTPQTGFDCSGLMQWAYAQQGITIPRVTYDQVDASGGTSVKRGDLLPGDLVFFGDPGAPHHVGMSLGGDKFLHAPSTGDVVKISSLNEPYFAQGFSGARRFDEAGSGAPQEQEVRTARAAHARDADEARRPETAVFQALRKQESTHHRSTVHVHEGDPPGGRRPRERRRRCGRPRRTRGLPGQRRPEGEGRRVDGAQGRRGGAAARAAR